MSTEQEKFWTYVVIAARGLGIDVTKFKSWETLAAAVVAAMDSECCVCHHRPSKGLGLFEPRDPSQLRLLYIVCDPDNHTPEQVEDALLGAPITKAQA
jgi:hypothetical protein